MTYHSKLPFKPKWSRKYIEKKLSADYNKMSYSRFMWWRSYCLKNNKLSNRHPFRDRILNGDFDQGSFLLEIELVYHTMNDKYIKATTQKGEVDYSLWHSDCSIDRARKKRLEEDFTKDEAAKLSELKKLFSWEFRMETTDYDKEIDKTSSKSLIDFYYDMEEKYGKRARVAQSVPKFK